MKKSWKYSKTIQFFGAVFAAGGIDLVEEFIRTGEISWRSVALLVIGIVGIALRLRTKHELY